MKLTLDIPEELARQLQELADREFRTPEAQILWLIKTAFMERRILLTDPRTDEEKAAAGAALRAEIERLYIAAGRPSTRKIRDRAREAGLDVAHTTVHQALTAARPISWHVADALRAALNGDPERIKDLWIESQGDRRG